MEQKANTNITNIENVNIGNAKVPNLRKGITLISLVITIILLLILASVAISLAVNADGLFPRAEYAKDKWNEKVAEEETEVGGLLSKLEEMVPEGTDPDEPPAEPTKVYARLYEDGTLILSSTDYTDPERVVAEDYGDISEKEYHYNAEIVKMEGDFPGWLKETVSGGCGGVYYSYTNKTQNVIIYDKIVPTNTSGWFYNFKGTRLDLTNLSTNAVTDMSFMFCGCNNLKELVLGNKFYTNAVTNMQYMFSECRNLLSLDLGNRFNTSAVTNMQYMFNKCSNLTSLNLGHEFDTSAVTDMQFMFNECSDLTSLNLENKFNTAKVTSMRNMFCGCSNLTSLNLRDKFDTKKVTDMAYMFARCEGLTSFNFGDKFDTNNVTTMLFMFLSCYNLEELDISSFAINDNVDIYYMLAGCGTITVYVKDESTKTLLENQVEEDGRRRIRF